MLKIKRKPESPPPLPRQLPAPRPDNRPQNPREAFSREFFQSLERDLAGDPLPKKSVIEKAGEFRNLEHEFQGTYLRLMEIMRQKEVLRAEIISDLAADRAAMEEQLKEIERLADEFAAMMPALPAPLAKEETKEQESVR